jgi:hypothetical protein
MKKWKELLCPDIDLMGITGFVKKLEKHKMIYSGMPDGDSTEWLIEGVLARGWNMMVSGAGGCGKSVFVMDMCMHLLSGEAWLGFKVQAVKNVLVFQCENPSDIILKRLQLCRRHVHLSKEDVTKGHVITRKDQRYDIINRNDREAIIKLGRKFDSEVIIFDSLSKYHSQDENDPTEMTTVMKIFDELRLHLKPEVAIIVIHHDGYSGHERGATSLRAWPEVLIGIKGKACKEQKIIFRKSRAGIWPSDFKVKGTNYTFVRITGKEAKDIPVLKALKKHFPKGCNKGELQKLLKDKLGLSRRDADDAIKLAITNGDIEEIRNPQNKKEKIITG